MYFGKLEAYIDSLGEVYGLHSVDCRVMQNHREIFRRMRGFRDYGHQIPVSRRDLYTVYSCTKVITMTAVMQVYEQGRIGLDDPVDRYLPAFREMYVSDEFVPYQMPPRWPRLGDRVHPAPSPITLRQLMTMTSGLSYDTESQAIQAELTRTGGMAGTVSLAEAMAEMPLLFDPGTRYSYSLGHDVMAAVVEVVTGQRYRDYLQTHIFAPLGLKDMYLHVPEAESHRLSAQYGVSRTQGDIQPMDVGNRYRLTPNYDSGGAGLTCSVEDYSLVLDALACGGVGHNGCRILKQESIDLMRTPQLSPVPQADFQRSGKRGYGYGLGVRTLIDPAASRGPVGEFGWDGAAGAYAAIDPENHISIFYAQEVLGMMKAYDEIHPTIRDLVYEALE